MIDRRDSEGIALIRFAHPPVNALSIGAGLVQALTSALRAALEDAEVRAVVLAAGGSMFSAGADIDDFERYPDAVARMRNLTSEVIEASGKPIIAVIHGLALGGGLELALSAHYRLCTRDAQFGLPEVSLGLLPGAGGTQRLPRLIGAEAALALMLAANRLDAVAALRLGLVDRIADGDPVAEAIMWAHTLVGIAPPRCCERVVPGDFAPALSAAGANLRPGALNTAPSFILECVRGACSGSFAAGMQLERKRFEQLLRAEASFGLRHVFRGQRDVSRVPGLAVSSSAPITAVAVVGAGLMGSGIALALLNADLPVRLVEPQTEARVRARDSILNALQREVIKGRASEEQASAREANLALTSDPHAVADVPLVIEAVFESLPVKQQLFTQLDQLAAPGAILASNTSTLDINAIAAVTRRPEQVVGLHFFSPAPVMKLIEVVRGKHTAPKVLHAAMSFARRIGKLGVCVGVCDGFVGNRMFEEMLRQAYFLLEEGALPAQIDAALEDFGMAMGPLKVMDLAGQDIGWSIRKRRAVEQPNRPYSRIPDLLCQRGRFGQKTGAGFYRYADGRTAEADAAVDALIIANSATLPFARRMIGDAEIVDRCVFALVQEGWRILEEGIASRPVDIDMVYVFGYGFPRERGGPMFYAQRLGHARVLARMHEFARGPNGWCWQ